MRWVMFTFPSGKFHYGRYDQTEPNNIGPVVQNNG